MRITKEEVQGMFRRLWKAIYKVEELKGGFLVENLSLDYSATYGGWLVVRRKHGETGESHPFGNCRLSTKEMYKALHMAACALEMAVES